MSEGKGRSPVPWRIIGVGSPMAGDDLGWLAIAALTDAGLDRDAELLALDRPGPALIEYLRPDARVILIDAMDAGLPPGSVRELVPGDIIVKADAPSSHHLGLAETLALARALGVLPRYLHVVGIQMGAGVDRHDWQRGALAALPVRIRRMMHAPAAGAADAAS